MEKYMGNKSKLLDFIYENIEKEIVNESRTIFDAFSGTTNVGKFFKKNGYDVISNDINDFSYILGKCYIDNKKIPKFKKLIESFSYFSENFKKVKSTNSFKQHLIDLINQNKNMLSTNFLNEHSKSNYFKILNYLTYYASPGDYDNSEDKNNKQCELFLEKNYCEFGENSKYINLVYKKAIDNVVEDFKKGKDNFTVLKYLKLFYEYPFDIKYLKKALDSIDREKYADEYERLSYISSKDNIVGNRKFFSTEHAKRLDIILNTIIFWKNMDFLENYEYEILLTSVIETIAIFSNTSATYQAFYKDYKANTLQPFRLIIPELIVGRGNYRVIQGDVCNVIENVNSDILYLDPPYNWRQYDSNYHLLNTIAKYHKIDNVSDFEKNIVGASGENRIAKLQYTSFNQRATFETQLFEIIRKSRSKIIALSYSDSESNHNVNETNKTIKIITNFMKNDSVFIPGSLKVIKYNRKNFESRKNNKKQKINELLFIVKKK